MAFVRFDRIPHHASKSSVEARINPCEVGLVQYLTADISTMLVAGVEVHVRGSVSEVLSALGYGSPAPMSVPAPIASSATSSASTQPTTSVSQNKPTTKRKGG
jgi:hypothetical protein